jgi:hypothetical protein
VKELRNELRVVRFARFSLNEDHFGGIRGLIRDQLVDFLGLEHKLPVNDHCTDIDAFVFSATEDRTLDRFHVVPEVLEEVVRCDIALEQIRFGAIKAEITSKFCNALAG